MFFGGIGDVAAGCDQQPSGEAKREASCGATPGVASTTFEVDAARQL